MAAIVYDMEKRNYNRMRKVARTGKEDIDEHYPLNIEAGNVKEYATMRIARADVFRKKRDFYGALDSLWEAYEDLSDDPLSSAKVVGEESAKYGRAMISRAERVIKDSKDSPEAYELRRNASDLIRRVERDFVKRENRKRVRWMLILPATGLIGGSLLLSSKLTGSVIGLNQYYSNLIGASLIIIGLIGGFFWFRGRKKYSQKQRKN